jgi:hypothetical protein
MEGDIVATIQSVIEQYKEELKRAQDDIRDRRDQRLRELAEEHKLRQVDLIKATGYSRETVRQILRPEVRDAVRKATEAAG